MILTAEQTNRKRFTTRGSRIHEFKDIYGDHCSIQQSSLATKEALWLGREKGTHYDAGHVVGIPQDCACRMHIDKKLARWLIKKLERFVRTGNI